MPPVSASKQKRLAEKAAKTSARKKGATDSAAASDTDSLRGSTKVATDSATASVVGDGDDVAGEMQKLKMATDRCVVPYYRA
jgi:ATP-binding cassette subfamily F protein 2